MKCNKPVRKWVLMALGFLALPLVAKAEGPVLGEKVFSIGPRASYTNPKNAENSSWSGGAQARAHLSPGLALEASIDYRKNHYPNDVTIESYPLQASVLGYLLPHSRISPFLAVGTGWYFTRLEGPLIDTKTDNRFGLHAGGGLEFMLTESLSVDGSYRYIWISDLTTHDTLADKRSYRDSSGVITMAMNLLF